MIVISKHPRGYIITCIWSSLQDIFAWAIHNVSMYMIAWCWKWLHLKFIGKLFKDILIHMYHLILLWNIMLCACVCLCVWVDKLHVHIYKYIYMYHGVHATWIMVYSYQVNIAKIQQCYIKCIPYSKCFMDYLDVISIIYLILHGIEMSCIIFNSNNLWHVFS